MATTGPHYLTLDEYADLRNKQDDSWRKEFSSIRNDINDVKTDVDTLKTDVKTLKTDVESLKTDVEFLKSDVKVLRTELRSSVNELRTEMRNTASELRTEMRNTASELRTEMRSTASELRTEMRSTASEIRTELRNVRTAHINSYLKNPILPFRAPLVYDPISQKIMEPDRALFPRHAREFYALREPNTDRLRKILVYLASCYDVHIEMDHDAGDSGEDAAVLGHPAQTVDLLEGIFGLDEDNFIRFAERAQELDSQPSPQKKRFHTQQLTASHPAPVRQRLDKTELSPEHESTSSKGEGNPRLEWGRRTTPSSQRPTVNRVKKAQPGTADNGSTTNPFSSPRDSVH